MKHLWSGYGRKQNERTALCIFQNRECEYFACHAGADKENVNCLFCYCPLYALGRKCGGNFRYTESGIKDCTNCQFPHKRENYDKITARFQEIVELIRE